MIPTITKSDNAGLAVAREASTSVVTTTQSAVPSRRRGRRPTHPEHWTKVTVVLMDRQIVFLDRLAADIRASSGAAISRAHIIRSLIDALAASDVDLSACRTQSELTRSFDLRLRHRVPMTPPGGSPGPTR